MSLPDAIPVVHPPRKVPVALREPLKAELKRMESSDIIAKVDIPTDWVSSLVVAQKPKTGKLRVGLDPQALNKAIRRPPYPIHSMTFFHSYLVQSSLVYLMLVAVTGA